MRTIFFTFFVFISIGIKAQVNDSNKHTRNVFLTNKVMVNTLDGKPISFFLNHPGVDMYAKRFYRGELGVGDGNTLNGIADSLISCSIETKPFYFFIFNQIVELSNGEYEELVANKCKEFLEVYPCEFFHSFNQPELNINVVKWTNYIGITLKDRGSFSLYRTRVDSIIKANCPDIQDLFKSFMVEVRMCLVR